MMDEDCSETLENVSMTVVGMPLHNSEQMSHTPPSRQGSGNRSGEKRLYILCLKLKLTEG